MSIGFDVKDVLHKVAVKFTRATLPNAKKPYTLRTAHQYELDIHDVASKAEVYNISVSPKVIETGLTAGLALIRYLVSEGYKVKTPLFTIKIGVPGQYEGTETHLPEGVHAEPHLIPSEDFCDYINEHVVIEIDGMQDSSGAIGEAEDEATGLVNETATIGGFLTVRGAGLKIKADDAHRVEAGLFFEARDGARVPAPSLAVNEPLTLKTLVPDTLTPGEAYSLVVVTQGSVKKNDRILKETRTIRSMFTLTVQPGA